MHKYLKKLSPNTEFIIVISFTLGYSIFGSLWWASNFDHEVTYKFNDNETSILILQEIILLTIFGFFIKARGWKLSDFNIIFSKNSVYLGILLVVIYYGIYLFIYALFEAPFGNNAFTNVKFNSEITLPFAIALSIINPIFEEIIVVAYVVKRLETQHDMFFVVSISAFIRLSYHLYQGPIAAISILPLGLLFAYVYFRWRSIIPLIVAHGMLDFIGLYVYV